MFGVYVTKNELKYTVHKQKPSDSSYKLYELYKAINEYDFHSLY